MEGENIGIAFFLQADSAYSVKIYDLSGRLVNTLISQKKSTGKVRVVWDGRGRNNEILKTGIYLIKLTVVSPYSGECRNLIKAVVLGTRL
ncbi:MAG: T9SS type A sorting domain-containing protein [Spirochaetes bacterium]|nr:T9SS type A sorting domain-containing protein [Spirochaetota bacterium]